MRTGLASTMGILATTLALVLTCICDAQTARAATAAPPRAIVRFDPKLYDVKFEVVFAGFPDTTDPAIALNETPFVLPMIMEGAFSRVDRASMRPELWLDSRSDKDLSKRARIDEKQELGMVYAVVPLISFKGSTIRWNVQWRMQSWSCRVDESLLARCTWPREWPENVRDALEPQKGIESNEPFAKTIVTSALGEQVRTTPPWFAAKEILRTVVTGFRSVNSDGMERRGIGRIAGLKLDGAQYAVGQGFGSEHDLVATCVAALRAAGLPARPVVGIAEETTNSRVGSKGSSRTVLQSWGEVYMPEAGWVPFDPNRLRGSTVRQLKVADAWPGVGTMKDLNEWIPISWCFAPRSYESPPIAALWGWRPAGRFSASSLDSTISFQATSRGKGIDDPQ